VEVDAAVAEPSSYPTSSYYETARQQARQNHTLFEDAEPVPPAVLFEEPAAYAPIAPEPQQAHKHESVAHAAEPSPQLVPVPASVFDDDFFRKPHAPISADSIQADKSPAAWPEARVPSFAGYAGETEATDELDIPAFLRHRH
jgi:cell division protein FtsZ